MFLKQAKILFFVVALFSFLKTEAQSEIKWMNFKEALELNSKTPKKIYIDFYTDWCGWCKKMDATTFKDDTVVKFMNDNFYAVKFNAEAKDTVIYKGVNYYYSPDYKANELVPIMLNQKMGYPTSVYLDGQSNVITPVQGYKSTEDLLRIMRYIASDLYKTMTWEEYRKNGK
jgi:thioredoxin-related protein